MVFKVVLLVFFLENLHRPCVNAEKSLKPTTKITTTESLPKLFTENLPPVVFDPFPQIPEPTLDLNLNAMKMVFSTSSKRMNYLILDQI